MFNSLKKTILSFTFLSFIPFGMEAQDAELEGGTLTKLVGEAISSGADTGSSAQNAFDGDVTTGFRSSDATHGWVGYQFENKQVVKQVRWYNEPGTYSMSIQVASKSNKTMKMPYSCLAVFEGANKPDFSDALPLYMVTSKSTTAGWNEADVVVTRGFRYLRYVGPNSSSCRVREVEFYGEESEGSDKKFYQPTNLPVVVVHTAETVIGSTTYAAGTDPWDKENDLEAGFSFISQQGGKIMEQPGTFRERGNSSREFGKRPYRVKLKDKQKVFSADYKAKKWTLVPAFDDKTFMRNIIGYKINEGVGLEYTPYCNSVDVFVNGEFKGQYQFCDQVEANKNRIDIEEIESTVDPSTGVETWPASAYDFGWFIEIDKLANKEPSGTWFDSGNLFSILQNLPNIPVTIKSPGEDEITSTYLNQIKQHFINMEKAAYNKTVEDYLDLDSFVRYFLAVEFVCNSDGYHSMYMHKHVGDEKFYTGPMWDLNLTLNNDERTTPIANRTSWSYTGTWADAGQIKNLMQYIFDRNGNVLPEVKDVWANIRETGSITTEDLLDEVEHLREKLAASADLNYMRWDILGMKIYKEKYYPATWQEEVDNLKNCLAGRVGWMDGMLGTQAKSEMVTITEAGWATVFLPMAFTVPEGLECYEIVAREDNSDLLVINPVEHAEANKPYLLHGEAGQYVLNGYSSVERDARTLGLLTGTTKKIAAPVGSYVLQNHDGRVCFYRVAEGTTVNVGAKRAYLTLPEGMANASIRAFYLDDEAEGLDEVPAVGNGMIYVYDITGNLMLMMCEDDWSESEVMQQLGRGMYIIKKHGQSRKVTVE